MMHNPRLKTPTLFDSIDDAAPTLYGTSDGGPLLRMKPGKPFVFGQWEREGQRDEGTKRQRDEEQSDHTVLASVPQSLSPSVPSRAFIFGLLSRI